MTIGRASYEPGWRWSVVLGARLVVPIRYGILGAEGYEERPGHWVSCNSSVALES